MSSIRSPSYVPRATIGTIAVRVLLSPKRTLITYCEKRVGTSDRAVMDIVYKRGIDNGKTWSDSVVLADGISNGSIMDNPVMVSGRDGRLHCIYTKNVGKQYEDGYIAYTWSDDDGITWSEPRDISSGTAPSERGLFASEPGHGIQLSNGALVIPDWYSLNLDSDEGKDYEPSVVCTLYSLDNGETWQMGESIFGSDELINPNECAVVELSDHSVMINIRSQTDNYLRCVATSPTGYSDWSEPYFDEALKSPLCFGSLCRYDDLILFVAPVFNPENPKSREAVSIRVSDDEGNTWSFEKNLIWLNGDYTDINSSETRRPHIYALSEAKEDGRYSIKVVVFNYKWLKT